MHPREASAEFVGKTEQFDGWFPRAVCEATSHEFVERRLQPETLHIRRRSSHHPITDCNLQIRGPEKWTLYVAWEETPVGGEEAARREWTTDHVSPELCPTPETVLETVRAQVEENGKRYAAAVRAAGEFASGG